MSKKRAGIALLCMLIVLSVFSPLKAQENNYRVVEVVVEGNRVASQSLILGVSAIDLGSPLTPTVTAETIRRLYGLDIFSDVRLEAEEVPGGLKVFIVVKELPKLTALNFEGNDKIDDKDLKEEISLGVGGYISPFLIQQKTNQIKNKYAEKGYFQAQIKHELVYNADSTEAQLTYKIDEKSKVKVQNVVVSGAERVNPDDVVGKMRNRKRGFLKSSDFAQDKYQEDLEKVIEEFHKKGFIDAYMISDSTSIDTSINRMTIYLDVYEGPQYYFGNVTYEGLDEMPQKYLESKQAFATGDIFNLEKYDKTIEEIYSAYYNIGHLHIRLLDERTTRADSIIDISYQISEGLPSHINLVNIVGNRRTKDHVVRRELSAFPGQKFNRELLIRSVRDAMALNYFSNVVPNPVNLPNGDVDIEFKVEEKQTGQVSAGAGFNSQDKLVGNAGMGIPNFRGMGQNLSFNTEFGSRRSSFSISFTEPWLFGRPTLFGTDIYSTNRRWYDEYTEQRQGFSLRFGRRLRWPDNYFRVYTSYRLEQDKYHDFNDSFKASNSYKDYYQYLSIDTATGAIITVPDTISYDPIVITQDSVYKSHYTVGDAYPGSILEYEGRGLTASRISLNITRDSRNLPEFATKGSKISYTYEKTGGLLGGYWKYDKHQLSVAKFFPLFWNIALATKLEFGAVINDHHSDKKTLLSDRFTPGGTAYDGIVRGYEDGTLTPDSLIIDTTTTYLFFDSLYSATPDSLIPANADSTNTTINDYYTRVRGNFMLISNIELQIPLVDQQIYLLGFYDAGNSWLRWRDMIEGDGRQWLYQGAGLGFRIAVPGIGTIGFDYAYAFNEARNQEKGWKWHFQIGTVFR